MGVVFSLAAAMNIAWEQLTGEIHHQVDDRLRDRAVRRKVAKVAKERLDEFAGIARRPLQRLVGHVDFTSFVLHPGEIDELDETFRLLANEVFQGLTPADREAVAGELVAVFTAVAMEDAEPLLRLVHDRVEQVGQDQLSVVNLSLGLYSELDARFSQLEGKVTAGFDRLANQIRIPPTSDDRPSEPRDAVPVWALLDDDGGRADLLAEPPPAPGSRDDELHRIEAMLRAEPSGAILLRGGVFWGKTTVMAELARRLTTAEAFDVVVLKNERNAAHLPMRPLQALNVQIIGLLRLDQGVATDREGLVVQHRELRRRAAMAGRRMVVLIDALDEAPDRRVLLEALALPPPDGVWLVASTRYLPELPPDHFLDRLQRAAPDHVLDLDVIPEARERQRAADAWIDAIATSADPLEHALFAAVVVAGAPMDNNELADLLDVDAAAVNALLYGDRYHSWFARHGDGRYRLGHDYLYTGIGEALGPRALREAGSRIGDWATRYRAEGWSSDTPRYLVEHLATPASPLALPDRVSLLLDDAWTQRRYGVLAEWRTLHQLGLGLLEELAAEHAQGLDRLDDMVALALRVAAWRRAAAVATDVILAHADDGDVEHAANLARDAATTTNRSRVLLELAQHGRVDPALRSILLHEAGEIASRLADGPARIRTYIEIGKAGLPEALTRAQEEARSLPPGSQEAFELAAEVGIALAGQRRFDESHAIAADLGDTYWRARALAELREAIAGRAHGSTHLEAVSRMGFAWTELQSARGRALHEAGRSDEARSVLRELEQIDHARAFSELEAGPHGHVLEEMRGLADHVPMSQAQLDVTSEIATALIDLGRLGAASAVAGTVDAPGVRAQLLRALAAAGSPSAIDEASRAALQVDRPAQRVEALLAIAAAGGAGALEQARAAAEQVVDSTRRIDALLAVATAGDRDALGEVRRSLRGLPTAERVDLLLRMAKAGDAGALDEALAAAAAIDRRRRVEPLLRIGIAFADCGRLTEARRVAKALDGVQADELRAEIALALLERGQLEAARRVARELEGPWRSDVLIARGKAFLRAGRLDGAWQIARRIDHGRGYEAFVVDLGRALAKEGRHDRAVQLTKYLVDPARRVELMEAISSDRREEVLDLAVRSTYQLAGGYWRAKQLIVIARAGRHELLQAAREIAQQVSDFDRKIDLVISLGRAGEVDAFAEACDLALSLRAGAERARRLIDIANAGHAPALECAQVEAELLGAKQSAARLAGIARAIRTAPSVEPALVIRHEIAIARLLASA